MREVPGRRHAGGRAVLPYLKDGGARQKGMAARFVNDRTLEATARFMGIADGLGVSVTTLATAWSKQHDFVASTIIGASELAQLDETLSAADLELDAETLAAIDLVEKEIPLSYGEDGLRFQ